MREIGPRPGQHPHPAHWSAIRLLALDRDKGCRACAARDGLEVHHRSYERFGREALDDVTVLCRDCHDLITGAQMKMRDDRRILPAERVTVTIERFAPPSPVEHPAPLRVAAEIERFPNAAAGDLPPPGRNVR